ncbi:unnamed protein product [Symbiodinium sp. CCMP2592]|nr:unnamed protein product [Symbiodinium sp. CCMP2592]
MAQRRRNRPLGKRKRAPTESVLLDLINSCTDQARRKQAFREYNTKDKAVVTAVKDKDLAVKDKELAVKEAVKDKDEQLVALKVENKMLHQGLLQVQGLLTSRGLFERIAQLAFAEQKVAGHVKGTFNCTSALEQVVITPQSGPWSKLLKETIKKCAPAVGKSKDLQKKELQRLWADLSNAIHGHAWYGPGVKVVAALSKTGKCVIARLAEAGIPSGAASPEQRTKLCERDAPDASSAGLEVVHWMVELMKKEGKWDTKKA